MRIIVSGMVAGNPRQGGAAWAVLQYVLGLLRLGHDAHLVEPVRREQLLPASSTLESSQNAQYFRDIVRKFELEGRASLILDGTTETVGVPYANLQAFTKTADAALNISGMLRREDLLAHIPVRVFLDLDPAFIQLWHATENVDMGLGLHNRFVTVGLALGQPDCSVPTCGVTWITTLQPVVLNYWPVGNAIVYDAFTTVGNWRSYGSIEHQGVHYGQKAHSLRPLFDLPTKSAERFALALGIDSGEVRDLEALQQNGWILLDPLDVAGTPDQYGNFVRGSKAEFGIAKSGYVKSRCGWFSDRSACYLASGRPVLAEDTGFGAVLPSGAGLFRFTDSDDALAAIEEINRDYDRHSRSARSMATEFFESGKVLSKLLDAVGASA